MENLKNDFARAREENLEKAIINACELAEKAAREGASLALVEPCLLRNVDASALWQELEARGYTVNRSKYGDGLLLSGWAPSPEPKRLTLWEVIFG